MVSNETGGTVKGVVVTRQKNNDRWDMKTVVIGADVLDSTGQSVVSFGRLEEENTWFELSPGQRGYFDAAQRLNRRLRRQSHSIQQLLWKSGYQRLFGDMPSR